MKLTIGDYEVFEDGVIQVWYAQEIGEKSIDRNMMISDDEFYDFMKKRSMSDEDYFDMINAGKSGVGIADNKSLLYPYLHEVLNLGNIEIIEQGIQKLIDAKNKRIAALEKEIGEITGKYKREIGDLRTTIEWSHSAYLKSLEKSDKFIQSIDDKYESNTVKEVVS